MTTTAATRTSPTEVTASHFVRRMNYVISGLLQGRTSDPNTISVSQTLRLNRLPLTIYYRFVPILQSYLTGDFVRTDAYYIQPAFRIDPPSTNTPSPGTFTTNALADFSREMVQALRQPLIPRAQPSLPHPQSNTLFHAPAVPAQARWETASHADSDIDSEVEEDGTSREEWRMIDEDLKEATTDSCLISNAQTLWSRDRKHVQSEYKAIDRLAAGLYEHLNNDRPQKN